MSSSSPGPNPWFIILIILVFVVLGLLVGTLFFNTNKIASAKNISVIANVSDCTPALNTLLDISSDQCCVQGGITTSSRYVPSLNMVLNTTPQYYITVCQGYCTNGFVNNQCVNTTFQEQENYNTCVNELIPTNCTGSAMPVGVVGTTYYYAQNVTNENCTTTAVCTSS